MDGLPQTQLARSLQELDDGSIAGRALPGLADTAPGAAILACSTRSLLLSSLKALTPCVLSQLSHNQFVGCLPSDWPRTLPLLVNLRLEGNALSGAVPDSLKLVDQPSQSVRNWSCLCM